MAGLFNQFRNSAAYRLIRNSLLYGIGDLLQKFLAVLLIPIYTQYLKPSDYGVLALLSILIIILCTITSCGLTNGISRYFFYSEENASKNEIIWSPLIFVAIVSAFVVGALIIFSEKLSSLLLDTTGFAYLVTLTLINVFASNIAAIARTVLVVEEQVWRLNFVNISGVVVGVLAGVICVVYMERGVRGAVEAGLLASIFMAVTLWFFAMPKYRFAFNLGILKKQLRFSLPLVTAVIAFFFIDSSDRYLLNLYLPLSEVGLYNIGYQGGMVMMLIVGGFSTAWPPFYHKNNQNGDGQKICSRVLNYYLPVASLFALVLSLSAPFALRLLTPQSYHEAYSVVPFVAWAYLLKGPYLIFLMGVLMKEKTSWQLSLEASAAVLNIGLNILLIPMIGREAAAITTLVSYTVMVLGAWWMTGQINPIPNLSLKKPVLIVASGGLLSGIVLIPGYASVSVWVLPLIIILGSGTLIWWIKKEMAGAEVQLEA